MSWEKFKKLSEVDHVLARPGRYIGSINPETKETWWIGESGSIQEGKLTTVPAFHKLFDEIISNSADHSRKPEGKLLTSIDVSVNAMMGIISVTDNGGIPVEIHPEYNQWIPDMIFGELRSGSNFDDDADSVSAGQNGEGASLTNIFSKSFIVTTHLNKKKFKMVYRNNMSEKSEAEVSDYRFNGGSTKIEYEPDLQRLNMTSITEDDMRLLLRRSYEIAFTNPKLKVTFNGVELLVKDFKSFVQLYYPKTPYQEIDRWRVGIGFSKDGFKHTSFVNSTPSGDGGTHVDYVTDKIVEIIRDRIETKTKQKVRPADIKNNLHLFIDCQINNPRYNSQTKEKLITVPSAYGSRFDLTDAFIKEILSGQLFNDILDWAQRRKDIEDAKAIDESVKAIKKAGFHDIPKYRPATSKDRSECILFLTEGDSALAPLEATINPKIHGIYPLQGKPENCFSKGIRKVLTDEILSVIKVMNLSISNPDYNDLRYKWIVIATDADNDGIHIRGLLILLFKKYWPEMLKRGMIKFLETPSRMVTYKGVDYDFVTEGEYDEFILGKENFKTKYYKGLGSHNSKKFETFLDNTKYFVTVDYDSGRDDDLLNMAFDPERADDRKNWVALI